MLPFSLGEFHARKGQVHKLTRDSMVFTNPTSYIVTVAEHAAAKILALGSSGGGSPSAAPSSVKPTSTKTSAAAQPTKLANGWEQCGGQSKSIHVYFKRPLLTLEGYTGPKTCVSGFKCTYNNAYYSQCTPA